MFCKEGSFGGGLLLGLRGHARDSRFHSEGLNRGSIELSGDNSESSVFLTLQQVQSGWVQPGLPGWGSVVDHAEVFMPDKP